MIRYALACACGHDFEAWFGSIRAFDELAAKKEIACPKCAGTEVRKALMAPRISSATGERDGAPAPDCASPTPKPAHGALLAAARRLRQEVARKADYVGPQFAEEARKIDAGEAPDRGIYGEATLQEAKSLVEDGIAVLPLPRLPEEHN